MNVLAVACGAAVGAMLRHGIAQRRSGWRATMIANLTGSLILGTLVGFGPSRPLGLLVGTGFCGALTTMSTLMLEASERPRRQRWLLLAAHVGLGLALAALGFAIGTRLGAR